jgi:hypothetical protein
VINLSGMLFQRIAEEYDFLWKIKKYS